MRELPVDEVLGELVSALRAHSAAILIAPPGSGKTTRAPPALADSRPGKVVLLQPRRVAARLAARRIASERGSAVGAEVGYRIRFENRTSAATRIEVVTEGLLTRMIQADPFLEGVGTVILDEFHERSLHADLALALVAQVQREARPDLKIVVMSATLDPAPIQAFFGGCPLIRAEGRVFPVEIEHATKPDERAIEVRTAAAIRGVLERTETGHVLAFLPGVGEIERTRERLVDLEVPVLPLHGRLKGDAQDRALAPYRGRKVVLATNIAETSVTLEGVVAVVDAGLHRQPRFLPRLGASRLELRPISAASATQRAGRAGRTGPGRCVRLWTAATRRIPAEVPEILRVDLAPALLQVYAWGGDPERFAWFQDPPRGTLAGATALLTLLGAVRDGRITYIGREMAALPLHPRLARVVLEGAERGCLREVATAAALVEERDPWPGVRADLMQRVAWVDGKAGGDRSALAAVRRVRDQLLRLASGASGGGEEDVIRALLAGFPDRVARLRDGHRYQLASGQGAQLIRSVDPLPWMLALDLSVSRGGLSIRLAEPIESEWLDVEERDRVWFDPQQQRVSCERAQMLGALVLSAKPTEADPVAIAEILALEASKTPRKALTFTGDVDRFLRRLRWLAAAKPELGLATFEDWGGLLESVAVGQSSFAGLRKLDLLAEIRGFLTFEQRRSVDRLAPKTLPIPSGSGARIVYGEPGSSPVLAARIQQLFGMRKSPEIAGVRVTVHLLAPNNRPQQVTADLESFWATTYSEVRKDLRGRYPKHHWPEDPLTARATDRAKRRPPRND